MLDSDTAPGAHFASVVHVPDEILDTPGAQAAAAVHCISRDDIAASPTFPVVWCHFLDFVEHVLNAFVVESSSEDEEREPHPPRLPDAPPTILTSAHNGYSIR